MEDGSSRAKSSALIMTSATAVVRQFVGSRIEKQVVAQVFDVVWGVSSPCYSSQENRCDDSVLAATRITNERLSPEGVIR